MNIKSIDFLGSTLFAVIDRPLGSLHPKWGFPYLINYGYIPGTLSGDGEEIDVYILGIEIPVSTFSGKCIAIIRRKSEDDDKLILAPEGKDFSDDEIRTLTYFQEQFFESEIMRNI